MNKKLFFILLLFVPRYTEAEIKLPALVGDNMVLQQNTVVKIWGHAKANSNVTVKVGWDTRVYKTFSDATGNWEVKVKTIKGNDTVYEMSISDGEEKNVKNILLGEVWLCGGQSNMEMSTRGFANQPLHNAIDEILDYDYPQIRFFPVRRAFNTEIQTDVVGEWRLMTPQSVETITTVGFNFAKIINKALKVPVGIIGCYWGGSRIEAWISEEKLKQFTKVEIKPENLNTTFANRTPTLLYNAMLHPVSSFTIKGCIFYQGEANVTNPEWYLKIFPELVRNWREQFSNNFPFYYVQLAPFSYTNMGWTSNGTEVARFREVQQQAQASIPNSGMIGTADIGAESTIHPPDKRTVAKRLAVLALTKTYGITAFNGMPPAYQSHTVEGNRVLVSFENPGFGLSSYGIPVQGLEIAGADRVFYPANAEVVRGVKGKIAVWNDKVKTPAAVRYCFKNYSYGNLYNSYGIAALPFRTDNY
ncbi:sialate O-acetylesterase [Desertivirga xinjiangensis]|uniref:sialate O-acetylesterase n=1 Tax=Desertivirga xinjiangensis TaxID=539206 RepID=UPI00210C6B65|nr:sialate O-acetylesterase [Pedobacter xinjiangensis]